MKNRRVMRVGGWALAVAALAGVTGFAGCKAEQGRSLVPVDVTAAADLTDLHQVRILIRSGGTEHVNSLVEWPPSKHLEVAYHLAEDVDGTVTVGAEGLDGAGVTIAQAEKVVEVTVKAGATSTTVALHLVRRAGPASDGGSPPDAGGDTAGAPAPDAAGEDGASRPDAAPADAAVTPDFAADLPAVTPDAATDTGTLPTPDAPARSWHVGENLQKDDLHTGTYQPDVAIDPTQGHVLAIWAGDGVVTVRRFDGQAMTWGPLQTLEMQGDPQGARIGLGANGHVLAVWYQYDGDGTGPLRGLWESHSIDGGKTWSKSLRVQMEWIFTVDLAMSATGEARVAWEVTQKRPDLNYASRALWSATYQASTGLFANVAEVKPAGDDTTNREPRIVMDGAGNGILAWQQLDAAGQESVWATGFSGAQPLKPQLLETNTTDRIFTHNVAMAPDGHKGMVVWSESEGANEWLMFNEYDAGVWKGPHREFSSSGFGGPAVAIDRAGVVTAAWSQWTGNGWNVAAARRIPGSGWNPGMALESTSLAKADGAEWAEPQLGVDGQNNVHVAWRRRLSATKLSFDVVARRFAAGVWQPETVLGHKETMRTYHPHLGVAEDGRAAAAFYFFTLFKDPDSTETEGYRAFVSLYR